MSGSSGSTITKVTAGGLVLVTMGLGSFVVVDKVVNKSDSSNSSSTYASSPIANESSGSSSTSSQSQSMDNSTTGQPSTSVDANENQPSTSSTQQAAPAQPSASSETAQEAAPPAAEPPSSSAAQPLPMPSNVSNKCHTGDTANANATLPVDYVRMGYGTNVSDCDYVVGVADEVRARASADHGLTSFTFSQYNAFRAGRIAKDGQVVTGSAATAKGIANKSNPDVEMTCIRHQGLTECNDTYGIGVKIWVQDDYL